MVVSSKDSSDDLSDADTEETLTHPLSSDESDSDDDGTESLASSVAELSSGMYVHSVSLYCTLTFVCRDQPEATISRPTRKGTAQLLYYEVSV